MTDDRLYEIELIGGNCPVQAEGWVRDAGLDHRFYFRARHDKWTMNIGDKKDVILSPDWSYSEPYPAAGWIEILVAEAMIEKALHLFWTRERTQD